MNKGLKAEKLEQEYWEQHGYTCRIFPKTRFYKQDFMGFDVVCCNADEWVLVQVKSRKDTFRSLESPTRKEMLAVTMPLNTRRIFASYNLKKNLVKRIEL